jgi:hypothetical protein
MPHHCDTEQPAPIIEREIDMSGVNTLPASASGSEGRSS